MKTDKDKISLPEFNDQRLLNIAFTHRSFLNENGQKLQSNERLEFFGDAILSFVVSRYLYLNFPQFAEGNLTDLRTALVNRETLARVSKTINLGQYLKLSKGEERSGGRQSDAILANTFEAYVAALYLDQGLEKVTNFLEKYLLPLAHDFAKDNNLKDFKSILQEKTQDKEKISPQYRVLSEIGPDHAKVFEIGVYLNKKMLAKGKGSSKHKAELMAAKKALEIYD